MASTPKEYTRIPGVGTGRSDFALLKRTRLYASADHLLIIENSGYVEEYRRVFYRDIIYIVIRDTRARLYWNLGFGISGTILAAFFLLFGEIATTAIAIMLASIMGLFILMNTVKGPACCCVIATAVQTLQLPGVRRKAQANSLLAFLDPHIDASQRQGEAALSTP